jgi:flagellar operon protein
MKVAELQVSQRLVPLQQTRKVQTQKVGELQTKSAGSVKSFADVLQEQVSRSAGVKFSAHALTRLEERNLQIGMPELARIKQGLQQLSEKGSRNSVILMDDTAFVVSVKNRTVVTAVDKAASVASVFTNIDSLAIV